MGEMQVSNIHCIVQLMSRSKVLIAQENSKDMRQKQKGILWVFRELEGSFRGLGHHFNQSDQRYECVCGIFETEGGAETRKRDVHNLFRDGLVLSVGAVDVFLELGDDLLALQLLGGGCEALDFG
jgi:hypothetical protein